MITLPGLLTDDELSKRVDALPSKLISYSNYALANLNIPLLSGTPLIAGIIGSALGKKRMLRTPVGSILPLNLSFVTCGDSHLRESKYLAESLSVTLSAESIAAVNYGNSISPLQMDMLLEQQQTLYAEDLLRREASTKIANEKIQRQILDDHIKPDESPNLNVRNTEQWEREKKMNDQSTKFAMQLLEKSGIELGRLELIRRPVLVANALSKDLISTWHRRTFDSSVTLILEGLEGMKPLAKGKDKEQVSDFIQQALKGEAGMVMYGGNITPQPSLSVITSLLQDEFQKWTTLPWVQSSGLLSHSIVLPPLLRTNAQTSFTEEDAKRVEALPAILSSIRLSKETPGPVVISDEAWEYYKTIADGVASQSELFLLPGYAKLYTERATQALKLAGCFAIIAGREEVTLDDLSLAISLIEKLRQVSHQHVEVALTAPCSPHDLMDQVHTMVRKLKEKGPCTRRDIYRCYGDQKKERHEPVLQKAILMGLIQENGNLLSVVDIQKRQRQSPATDVNQAPAAQSEKAKVA